MAAGATAQSGGMQLLHRTAPDHSSTTDPPVIAVALPWDEPQINGHTADDETLISLCAAIVAASATPRLCTLTEPVPDEARVTIELRPSGVLEFDSRVWHLPRQASQLTAALATAVLRAPKQRPYLAVGHCLGDARWPAFARHLAVALGHSPCLIDLVAPPTAEIQTAMALDDALAVLADGQQLSTAALLRWAPAHPEDGSAVRLSPRVSAPEKTTDMVTGLDQLAGQLSATGAVVDCGSDLDLLAALAESGGAPVLCLDPETAPTVLPGVSSRLAGSSRLRAFIQEPRRRFGIRRLRRQRSVNAELIEVPAALTGRRRSSTRTFRRAASLLHAELETLS